MNTETYKMLKRLEKLGIDYNDAVALRRIAMTLQRWSELECGDGYGYIERDERTGIPFYVDCTVRYLGAKDARNRRRIPDREAGAFKRLTKIMKMYPKLTAYLQADPRGAPLYILPANGEGTPYAGLPYDEWYNYGVAVHK